MKYACLWGIGESLSAIEVATLPMHVVAAEATDTNTVADDSSDLRDWPQCRCRWHMAEEEPNFTKHCCKIWGFHTDEDWSHGLLGS